jgi:hypothetical protein
VLVFTAESVHTGCTSIVTAPVDWKTKREELRAERDRLFERYLKRPNEIRLALEIKLLDDQVAECNEQRQRERRTRN